MAVLSTFEKYPDSWRIDHPDFGDVCKTSFVKGVISEVKTDIGSPEVLENLESVAFSLVKVKVGGGGESDFIPLFYSPKKDYWDTPFHKSQEFNQDQGYFENAWMSFRAGDEVVVMLIKGKPVAVFGFADGKPKVGEDVLKSTVYGVSAYSSASNFGNDYSGQELGPDGLNLNLTEKCTIVQIEGSGAMAYTPMWDRIGFFRGLYNGEDASWAETYFLWNWSQATGEFFNFVVLMPIGPIIYRVSFSIFKLSTLIKNYAKYEVREPYDSIDYSEWFFQANSYYIGNDSPDGSTEIGWPAYRWLGPDHPPTDYEFPAEMVLTQAKGNAAALYYDVYLDESYNDVYGSIYWLGGEENQLGEPNPLILYGFPQNLTVGPGNSTPANPCDAAPYTKDRMNAPMDPAFQAVNIFPNVPFSALNGLVNQYGFFSEALAFIANPDAYVQFYVRPHNG